MTWPRRGEQEMTVGQVTSRQVRAVKHRSPHHHPWSLVPAVEKQRRPDALAPRSAERLGHSFGATGSASGRGPLQMKHPIYNAANMIFATKQDKRLPSFYFSSDGKNSYRIRQQHGRGPTVEKKGPTTDEPVGSESHRRTTTSRIREARAC